MFYFTSNSDFDFKKHLHFDVFCIKAAFKCKNDKDICSYVSISLLYTELKYRR